MIQHTYQIGKKSQEDILREIANDPAYGKAAERLLLVYTPESRTDVLEQDLQTIREALPDAKVVGMSVLGALQKNVQVQETPRFSILLFESSHAEIIESDCSGIENLQAVGSAIAHQAKAIPNLKGILYFSADPTLKDEIVLEELNIHHPEIPIFGAKAGIPNFSETTSLIFAGEHIYKSGIILVALYGEDLNIKTSYSLGWKPLGREHTVSESDENGTISRIDGVPVETLYDKYLSIPFDSDFCSVACSFPLLFKQGNTLIGKVPLYYTADKNLQFASPSKRGSQFSFSYSKPEYLLSETLRSANELALISPDAVLIFACESRSIFMGNERAKQELDYFYKVVKEPVIASGNCEILFTANGGGILNSSIVSIALREGMPKNIVIAEPIVDKSLQIKKKATTSERLVSFLEKTTDDLNDMIRQLAALAEHDQLTHLYNRRKLNEILEYELSKRRADGDFSLLMYDIDFFKKVNDQYGHSVGDQVLVKISDLIYKSVRSCDVLGRWGGEEFVCILSNTNLAGAKILAERIRRRIESADFTPLERVTISIGVTEAKTSDNSQTLFYRLDSALYDAKNAGRNRVAVR